MRKRLPAEKPFILAAAALLAALVVLCSGESWAAKDKGKKTRTQQDAGGDVKWTKSPDAIPALIQLSNGRKDMVKDLNAEADVYDDVKAAAEKGKIAPGLSMDEVKAKYGEPVVVDTWNREGLTRWIYKKPSKDMASKEKISLIFDKDGKLLRTEEPK